MLQVTVSTRVPGSCSILGGGGFLALTPVAREQRAGVAARTSRPPHSGPQPSRPLLGNPPRDSPFQFHLQSGVTLTPPPGSSSKGFMSFRLQSAQNSSWCPEKSIQAFVSERTRSEARRWQEPACGSMVGWPRGLSRNEAD